MVIGWPGVLGRPAPPGLATNSPRHRESNRGRCGPSPLPLSHDARRKTRRIKCRWTIVLSQVYRRFASAPGPWPDAAMARWANLQRIWAAKRGEKKRETKDTHREREREREREANNYNKTRRLGACVGGFSPVALSSYCRAPRHTGTSVSIPHTHTSVKPHGRHLHMDLPKAFFGILTLSNFVNFGILRAENLAAAAAPSSNIVPGPSGAK